MSESDQYKVLMTPEELEICRELGKLHMRICAIMGDEVSNDRFEVMLHTHALQNMVMSTAARRAYPEHFRMLGQKP